jgi:cell wall assembly regulator SMI1
MTGVTDQQLQQAQQRLGVRFPPDYAAFLQAQDGMQQWFGQTYVELWTLATVVRVNEVAEQRQSHPGLLYIGGDGSREGLALDLRKQPPPVLLVGYVSTGWAEALFQAADFSTFLAQVATGGFRWEEGYQ